MDERTNKMLQHFADKGQHFFFDDCDVVFPGEESVREFGAIHDALMRYMRDTHDLIYTKNDMVFMLTARGIDIVDSGGWLAYWQRQNNEHNELVRLRTDREAFDRKHIKANTKLQVGMLICAIIGAIGVVYGIVQAGKNTKLEHQLETIKTERSQLLKETSDLNSLVETRGKEIQELTQKIDSLSQPSSLRNKTVN